MFYSWFLESGYVWKDGLQSAVRGVYLQNKLPFEVCTKSDWVTVKNYLLVLQCQWIQLKNYFFYKTIMVSEKEGKYGPIPLDCWFYLKEEWVPATRLNKSTVPVQNSYLPDRWSDFLLVYSSSPSS